MMAVGASGKDVIIIILIALLLYVLMTSSGATGHANGPQPTSIPGVTETGPIFVNITNTQPKIEQAMVRVLETGETDTFDQDLLSLTACANGQHFSVWAPGYYVQIQQCNGNMTPYSVTLEPVDETDNPSYAWINATSDTNPQQNCQDCHAGQSPHLNEYIEWNKDGHSRAFSHPYFSTSYMGTNIYGQRSQQIKWDILETGQKIYPKLDPFQPNYGPGNQLDFPVSNGNCALCHVPVALSGTRQELDLSALILNPGNHRISAIEGVTCDFCHKVTDVRVGKNQLPYDDRPGVLSMSILRPTAGLQFNTGPLAYQSNLGTDSKRTCYPVFSESRFCAACHYGKFANTQIYGSYKEWLESPYRDKYIRSADGQPIRENPDYRSCQDCHMLGQEQIANTLPSERDACSASIARFNISHNMMDYGPDPDNPAREIPLLVQEAAQIELEARLEEGQIKLKVNVTNTGAGHKFPTDSPLRHLILLLEARDWRENPLMQTAGPKVPVWAVPDYAGYAGEIYANVLKDKDTNLVPSFAYWNPVENAWEGSDTRLVPETTVQSEYAFAAPYDRIAKLTATLIYRRAFMNVVQQKGWYMGDLDVKVTDAILECSGFGAPPENMVCVSVTPTPTANP
jgi:hypothetical protein